MSETIHKAQLPTRGTCVRQAGEQPSIPFLRLTTAEATLAKAVAHVLSHITKRKHIEAIVRAMLHLIPSDGEAEVDLRTVCMLAIGPSPNEWVSVESEINGQLEWEHRSGQRPLHHGRVAEIMEMVSVRSLWRRKSQDDDTPINVGLLGWLPLFVCTRGATNPNFTRGIILDQGKAKAYVRTDLPARVLDLVQTHHLDHLATATWLMDQVCEPEDHVVVEPVADTPAIEQPVVEQPVVEQTTEQPRKRERTIITPDYIELPEPKRITWTPPSPPMPTDLAGLDVIEAQDLTERRVWTIGHERRAARLLTRMDLILTPRNEVERNALTVREQLRARMEVHAHAAV